MDIKIPKNLIKTARKQDPQRKNENKKIPCDVDYFAEYNEKSVQLYHAIHKYNDVGYSKRAIAKMVHCGKNTVTKYQNGDYESLCRKDFRSGMDQFYDHIISERSAGTSRKDVYRDLLTKGYQGGQSAAYDYMNKLIKRFHIDIAVYKSTSAESVRKKKQLQGYDHLSRSGVFRFLWMNTEITAKHKANIIDNYPPYKENACLHT